MKILALLLLWVVLSIAPLRAVQCGNPISDAGVGSWSEGAGNADANSFDELDEGITCSGSPDDTTTYWRSANNPTNDIISNNLTSLTDPAVDTGHVMRVRCAKSASGGRLINLTFRLEQGGATIDATCEDTSNTDINNTWTTYSLALASSCSSAITDYTDLDIEIEADFTGSGAGRRLFCSTSELELPNAPAGARTRAHTSITGM